jgi:hypothetical protein
MDGVRRGRGDGIHVSESVSYFAVVRLSSSKLAVEVSFVKQ